MSKNNDTSISSKIVLEKTGISRATLNNYIRAGIIPKPDVRKPDEDFNKKIKSLGYFPSSVIDTIEKVKALKKLGKSMENISRMLKGIDSSGAPETGLIDNETLSSDKTNRVKETEEENKIEHLIKKAKLKVTFEETSFPAYLLDFDFNITWINGKAEANIFYQSLAGTDNDGSRNIFKLIFNWEFHCNVKNWKDLIEYHMSFAKVKYSKTWLKRLYTGISNKEANILEKVYDSAISNSNQVINCTYINLLKKDGYTDKYSVFSLFFREGILFIYVPIIN